MIWRIRSIWYHGAETQDNEWGGRSPEAGLPRRRQEFSIPGCSMRKRKNTVTLKDIAEKAGVSPGAVSFVLNNLHKERRISAVTVEKVRRIARELGYHPNIAARNLRLFGPDRNLFVLSIITSAESPLNLVSHTFSGLQKRLRNEGLDRTYVTNISTFEPGLLTRVPGFLDGSFFNAAIITNTSKKDDEDLAKIELPYPAILIGREIHGHSSFTPSWDAGKVAAKALLASGARRPAILTQKDFNQSIERRFSAFMEEIAASTGRAPEIILARDPFESAAFEACSTALSSRFQESPFDGLFAVHDSLAVGAYLAIKESGLQIREDVKVVGVGDSEIAPYLTPPLSTAGSEEDQVFEHMAELFMERLRDPDAKPKIVREPARFVARGST